MTTWMVGRGQGLLAALVAAILLLSAAAGAAAGTATPGPRLAALAVRTNVQRDRDNVGSMPEQVTSQMLAAAAPIPSEAVTQEPGSDLGRVPPQVESFEPSNSTVPANAEVVVTFSQPMAPGTVEASFVIRPSVYGRQSWSDSFTFRFQPFKLEHATAYEVHVGGRSARGAPLDGRRVWRFTTAAGPPLLLAPGPSSVRVPILMYHYIRVNQDYRDLLGYALSVTPANFAAQMNWLASNGFHPITPADLYAYLSGSRGLPIRPVILSFDDGYADFYDSALPILRAHDFAAVAYVVSGFIGRPGYMSAAQISEADHSGIEIGSHTVDHANLARMSLDSVRFELAASKLVLEQQLGHPVVSFCYPSGQFNAGVAAAVRTAGYQNATTTAFGYVHYLSDRYTWSRLRVSGGESLSNFATALLGAS